MILRWWPNIDDARVASTRLRAVRVIEELSRRGIDCALFAPTDAPPDVLVLAKRYDHRSLDRARALQLRGTKVVLDLCDNHFHHDPPSPAWERRAQWLRDAVVAVDAVIASTRALAAVVRDQCPAVQNLHVVGDAVELPSPPSSGWRHPLDELAVRQLKGRIARLHQMSGCALLWFGNHGSDNAEGGMLDLLRLRNPLDALSHQVPIALTVISNSREKFKTVARGLAIPCEYLPWRPGTFSRACALHDVALLPIGVNPFTACKSNNRLATALVHGVAVAADPIESYLDFADSIVLADWYQGLHRLATDVAWRSALVQRGRQHIAEAWTLPHIADEWLRVLTAVYHQGRREAMVVARQGQGSVDLR